MRLQVVEILPAQFEEFVQEFDPEKIAVVQELIDYQQEKGYQKGWVYYQLVEMPELELSLGDWREVARLLGYKAGWGWYSWREMQSKNGRGAA